MQIYFSGLFPRIYRVTYSFRLDKGFEKLSTINFGTIEKENNDEHLCQTLFGVCANTYKIAVTGRD